MSIDTINTFAIQALPVVNRQKRHRLARLAQTQLKALTITEAGAAGSFLCYFLLRKKKVNAVHYKYASNFFVS